MWGSTYSPSPAIFLANLISSDNRDEHSACEQCLAAIEHYGTDHLELCLASRVHFSPIKFFRWVSHAILIPTTFDLGFAVVSSLGLDLALFITTKLALVAPLKAPMVAFGVAARNSKEQKS